MENLAAERAYPTPLAENPLLPMLLISLAIQKYTPDLSEDFQSEYDYIIIGSGTAGSVVASRLTELSCVTVLLLEAGKPPPRLTDVPGIARSFVGTDLDWNYFTVPQTYSAFSLPNRQVQFPSGKTIGGSSITNGMVHVVGNRNNYDTWAAQGATGWSYQDVLPYFKKLEDNKDPDYVSNGFHGTGGPVTVQKPPYDSELKIAVREAASELGYSQVDSNGPTQIGFYDYQSEIRYGQRCSASKAYLVPAESRTNLDIISEALVKKVVINNGRATGVQFDYRGKPQEVRAKREVILSAGAINSPQLLMLSGVGPREELEKHNIPVIADLPVGQNLQDHAGYVLAFKLGDGILSFANKLNNSANIQTYIDSRTGPLTSAEGTAILALLSNNRDSPPGAVPDHQMHFLEAGSEVSGLRPEDPSATFWCSSENLRPRSLGTVTLHSSDPYDPPLIDPNYYQNELDVMNVVQGLKTCIDISKSKALQKIGIKPAANRISDCDALANNEDLFLACLVRARPISLSHQVGTVKMGSLDDPTTVVDPELRVKQIEGLRVVDASIMPIIPSGNTNAPTLMIGEKASDMIKQTIKCT